MSSTMQPIEVVELLNNLFSRFDELVERYGLNKVKTIGDCYMVTSIPCGGDAGPLCAAVCSFGLDMIQALHEYNVAAEHSKNKTLGLRVGVHSGPVVAGVVGTTRFLYDIWGDAVRLVMRNMIHFHLISVHSFLRFGSQLKKRSTWPHAWKALECLGAFK